MTKLEMLRKKHNKKAADLARACGVSERNYYHWERGNVNMRATHALILAEIFGLDGGEIDKLIEDQGEVENVCN